MLQQAAHLLDAGNHAAALPLLRQAAPHLTLPSVEAAIGDCLHALGEPEAALEAYRSGLKRFPDSGEIALRLASRSLEAGHFSEALPAFRLVRGAHRNDAAFLRAFAYAALQAEQWREAAEQARAALALEPESPDARLVLALGLAGEGEYAEAAALLEASPEPQARALAAHFHFKGGASARALALFSEAEAAGGLGNADWAQASLAAAFAGQREQAERWLARAEQQDPGPATQLASAQVALLQSEPERALGALAPLTEASDLDDRALALALTARAHRLLDHAEQAEAALACVPAGAPPAVRALVAVERGHLRARAEDFEAAEAAFREALALDANNPEAKTGLERAGQRLSWKREVLADADRQVEAARSEAEAVRRAVAAREGELARLKRQLAELERQRQAAESQAREAAEAAERARAEAEAERKRGLRAELEAREAEARAKAEEEIEAAFQGRTAEANPKLLEGLAVAELTYQKALQTDLPGAGVAVLYSGVLERALFLCLVAELDRYLEQGTRRAQLLQASRRGERGGRPEYADHFVGAFDRSLPPKPPGLGEVARVLRRRGESHLALVREFLEVERGYPPAFLDALAAFVESSKERLRDPVAHGRVLEVGDREIAEFRRALLREFAGGTGILHRLSFPRG